MNRLFTAGTAAIALAAAAACTQNTARDPDQPIAAQRDSIVARDSTSPAYQAMKRADSATVSRTDTMARQDSAGRTPSPTVRDTSGTRPATTAPPK